MPLERFVSTTVESPGWPPETFAQMADRPHQLPIIYRTARRVYRDLLAVGAMTLAPGVGLPLIVLVAMGHRIVIVNGSPHLVHYTLAEIGALAAAGLAAILSGLLFLVAGSRVVLDHICGRPVSATRALWAILRRPHSFLLLAVQFGVAFTALVGAALWLSATVRSVIPGLILLLGVGVFLLLPAMTAWAALSDRVPPLRTVEKLFSRDYGGAVWMTALGFAGLPGLVQLGLFWASVELPAPAGAPIVDAVRMITSVLLAPVQAATLACCYAYLRQAGQKDPLPAATPVQDPGAAENRRRAARWPIAIVLACAVLPGLLYGSYVAGNPLGLVSVLDDEIGVIGFHDRAATTQVLFDPAGRPVVFRASGYPELIFCDDAACTGSRTTELREYFDIHPGVVMAADGSLAVAGWTHKPGWKVELETFSCRPDGCARRSGSPLRVAKNAELEVRAAAVATRNGIVIASIAPDPDDRDDRNGRNALVDLTTCPEITCAHPITVRLGRLLSHLTDVTVDERTLAVTASPDGRPIVAYADRYTQKTTLAICDSAVCAHPVIRTFDPTQWRQGAWSWGPLRVQVAVRPDGRPVIVRNDPHDLSTMIVVCRDRVCSGTPRTARITEVVALGTPGLTLDSRGRLLLVGYDRDYPLMSILACEDDACTSRSTARLVPAYGFGYFDLATGPDGRPRLLWYGRLGPAGPDAYHLLTCVDARCSA